MYWNIKGKIGKNHVACRVVAADKAEAVKRGLNAIHAKHPNSLVTVYSAEPAVKLAPELQPQPVVQVRGYGLGHVILLYVAAIALGMFFVIVHYLMTGKW